MDKQKEVKFLVETIERLQICSERIPEMTIDYPDNIQRNVIEISIEDQHLWYWKNGEVYMETDIVTGWKDKWDTPKGVYRMLNKIDGVYLTGADYKVWVDKWMRFWNGYGLHDAMWRPQFGGAIYTKNGSHGCINLPHDFAVKLYDMVEAGDCVVIY
jgi:lipoprotein-anchoring transpeptidase ErfK/SrfK